MKKITLIFLLICSVSASIFQIEQKIYSTVLHALFPHKYIIKIWTDDEKKKSLFHTLPLNVRLVEEPNEADILFVYHKPDIKTEKMIFAGSYHLLKIYRKQAIGGFYWQKGRPNLIFLKNNIHKYKIELPKELQKYLEDSI
ncbi:MULTISPECIES: hypothetical protein [unclassified Nitratiruptor]|uniref:hypothetical protein n=1 Tax=unclassified Nitratiruptor TaxID=2624044 RepID=UPI00191549B6|nr:MULTISPECIES: hypothetical protein [unclassified Nitratiruptor]BCD59642.1 iron complex outermembrane recepter protein [Nitratiruptor sp. YY08-10]BCD63566.1 hypothetical protein NitYY0814_C0393 [Nitratiruptor sp. YY08-14]